MTLQILTILIAVLFIYYLMHENFGGFNYIRLYGRYPWATYSSLDGSFLNSTFREPISRIDFNFPNDVYCELWGYVGKGIPEAEDAGNLYNNPNWELIFMAHNPRQKNTFYLRKKYVAYHITLVY